MIEFLKRFLHRAENPPPRPDAEELRAALVRLAKLDDFALFRAAVAFLAETDAEILLRASGSEAVDLCRGRVQAYHEVLRITSKTGIDDLSERIRLAKENAAAENLTLNQNKEI